MNRRSFFQQLASGLVAAAAPALFLPKLIKPSFAQTLKYGGVALAEPEMAGMMFLSYTIRMTANGIEVVDTSGLGPQPVRERPSGAVAVLNYKLDASKIEVAWDDLPAVNPFQRAADWHRQLVDIKPL